MATAGHVDHGKTTLVRLLTGMETDTLEEERRRGLTISLGYAWSDRTEHGPVAFVDVPGHARFLPTMLAGIGPTPAVVLVVAADEGWMPQTVQHAAALGLLEVRHAVVAVTKSDLADPDAVVRQTRERLHDTPLAQAEIIPTDRGGRGIDAVRRALGRMAAELPPEDPARLPRLWVDRRFTVKGSGTVVTGSLQRGTITTQTRLVNSRSGGAVLVRGLQALGVAVPRMEAPARLAVNIRGPGAEDVTPGVALVGEGLAVTTAVDLRTTGSPQNPNAAWHLHAGSDDQPVRLRVLDDRHVRATWRHGLPLVPGDRVILRLPGAEEPLVGGFVVDTAPPDLVPRGRRRRAEELRRRQEDRSATDLLARVHLARETDLAAAGHEPAGQQVCPGWRADATWWQERAGRLFDLVAGWRRHEAGRGPTWEQVAAELDLPDPALVPPLAAAAGLRCASGRVLDPSPPRLPDRVERVLSAWERQWQGDPFWAPDADALRHSRLDARDLALCVEAERVVRIGHALVMRPDVLVRAAERLSAIGGPFSLSAARQSLGTTRRVAVPLLEELDRRGLTVRVDQQLRTMRPQPSA